MPTTFTKTAKPATSFTKVGKTQITDYLLLRGTDRLLLRGTSEFLVLRYRVGNDYIKIAKP